MLALQFVAEPCGSKPDYAYEREVALEGTSGDGVFISPPQREDRGHTSKDHGHTSKHRSSDAMVTALEKSQASVVF